ncbi:uncharacterized protein LOC106713358 [Papilio machaon]|uniref:uncharacterized protein LOC106713358 n=1 Tax=Papilio machaon TaxID=76193 RepID=UPI001E663023|nr:uncharacterized protein LOC106713358 [Papilio machaon]
MSPIRQHYSSSTVNQYELSSRLLSLTENDASYTLTQINGQRIFKKAPHAWQGPEPSRKCEVFIGRIPHDCFEDTLVPLFRRAGDLFEFRLMINFSGWNRGYAFAMYATEAEASNAIRMFNNYMIRPAWLLGVCPSINNCRIYISRIPSTTPSADIVRLLYALTDEVQEVRIRRSMASCAAIVEYRSHRGAAIARKALVAAASAAWGAGARPVVDWSLPHSPQLLRQYREVGRWSPERGVELVRTAEETGSPPPLAATASYSLEPWVQVRRMRMIHEAAQRNTAAHTDWGNSSMSNDMGLFTTSMASLNLGGGLALEEERAVWSPVEPAAVAEDYVPALQRNGGEPFIFRNGAVTPAPRNGSVPTSPFNIDSGDGACNGNVAGAARNGTVPLTSAAASGGLGGLGELDVGGAPPEPDSFPSPLPGDFNPWTAYHPMQDFIGRKARE